MVIDRSRRSFLVSTLAAAACAAPATEPAAQKPILVQVWKSPTCGCCQLWVEHMQDNGFRVEVHDTGNTAVRARLRIPARLAACHTAWVGRYAIEGHVPARDVWRLIQQQPDAVGLAVPGMPVGSPGMDGSGYGGRRDAYDVLLVAADGSFSLFSSHR